MIKKEIKLMKRISRTIPKLFITKSVRKGHENVFLCRDYFASRLRTIEDS